MDLAAQLERLLRAAKGAARSLRPSADSAGRMPSNLRTNLAVLAIAVAIFGVAGAALPGLVPELPENWNRHEESGAMAERLGAKPDPIALLAISPEPLAAPMALEPLPMGLDEKAPEAGSVAGLAAKIGFAGKAIMGNSIASNSIAGGGEADAMEVLTAWGGDKTLSDLPGFDRARQFSVERLLAPQAARAKVQRAIFPKWSGVMEKSYAWDADFDGVCGDIVGRPCGLADWQAVLARLEGERPMVQLDRVNRLMNQVRYREDSDTWGRSDYWATPGEFFAYGGDCEDFAVAKYYSLRMLGYPAESMRIVVLEDLRLERTHAVLVVELGGRELMLDNQYATLVDWRSAEDYQPFYSVNEETFEIHEGLKEKARAAT